jgi:hypothetical protein
MSGMIAASGEPIKNCAEDMLCLKLAKGLQ